MANSPVLDSKTSDPSYPYESNSYDHEKAPKGDANVHEVDDLERVQVNHGFLGKLWAIVNKLDKYGVEARGIERVPPTARHHMHAYDALFLWLSANMTISTLALGCLGNGIWLLGFRDAALTIIFFNLLSTLPVAWFSVWGARSGLRQMTLGRFSFGRWAVCFPVLLNCIACVGWSTINSIVGAQTLRAVSDTNQIPTAAAIVVIAILTMFASLFGYKFVHSYERVAWVIPLIIFCILAGESGRFMTQGDWGGSGPIEAASVLSFGSAIVGFGLGWSSLAADYTVNMPENTNGLKLFLLTYLGLNTPLILVETLGAALMTTFTAKPEWGDAYANESVGGLLGAVLRGELGGFGSFLLVLLALSIVANNIPNIYSLALTFQVFGKYCQYVPRMFLVIIGTGIYIALAIVGASHFESWLDTLLVILAYWLAIYSTILIEEHVIFRKGRWSNYEFEDYTNWRLLPLGAAAAIACIAGIAGAVLGMAQLWYVGVLGGKIGLPEFGGDIGFELALGFSGIVYPPARYLEKKYWGH